MAKQRKYVLLIQIYATAYGLRMLGLDSQWCVETPIAMEKEQDTFMQISFLGLQTLYVPHNWLQKQEVAEIKDMNKNHKCHDFNVSLPEVYQTPLFVFCAIRKHFGKRNNRDFLKIGLILNINGLFEKIHINKSLLFILDRTIDLVCIPLASLLPVAYMILTVKSKWSNMNCVIS